MASPQSDKEKLGHHWPPVIPRGPRGPPVIQRRRLLCCRNLMVLLVVAGACCVALFRASGLAATAVLSTSAAYASLYGGSDNVARPGNKWASESLPKGDWPKDQYLLGVGKADITGPVVEINMMGYADFAQIGRGLRQRLYSRAFIVGDMNKPEDRFVYLVLDIQSGDTAVRYGILRGLEALGSRYSMYGQDNVAVTATHSHSGPGAWLNYLLPQIPSMGFDQQSYRAIVEGCILSIRRAHESLAPGHLSVGKTKIMNANINRSLFAYLANPPEERARYNMSSEDDGSVEKDMTLLKFQRASDKRNIGVLTWFPTHGTSMQANNTLVTGDNKGLAADMFEKQVLGNGREADGFVAGFSQANMGDASPNVLGAWCEDGSGQQCDFKTSACSDGRSNRCRARGSKFGRNDYGAASCFENARLQHEGAVRIYNSLNDQEPNIREAGVKAIHRFHDMSFYKFTLPNGSEVQTCPAALGYGFGAGTWDEPGDYDLLQHASTASNARFIWRLITWLLKPPTKKQVACQHPKSIILDVGEVSQPYAWTPNVVDIQTFRVGRLFIIVSPGEATTMAGRRWKEAVAKQSIKSLSDELDGQEPVVVLGAPSNSYTHYISTPEEYGIQRYEGASTLYGPHTLSAYMERTIASMKYLKSNSPSREHRAKNKYPPDNSARSISFIIGVLFDRTPWYKEFGDVVSDVPNSKYSRGEKVSASFVGANPRNNLRLEQTYAAVEYRPSANSPWQQVRDDSDWTLSFHWRRTSKILGLSEVDIRWEIEDDAPAGEYRLRYYGDSKSIRGRLSTIHGVSSAFSVV
ncbi:Neutral/alkaline nonlysosomal ceramidase [Metarhizium rileyi]|uniref:Neutral ceramidase n=1 Tax=Metarhizium rileyi (strain RCEF 4871) TaxID=1649241 RepID=A0A167DAK8_METRR|nr:Neutral/alkaline nonlysosomal ceramidase [Metarhizium rileyi RCEF 4871]